MNTFKQAAIEVLTRAGKPLHFTEITRLALEHGLLETEGATPERTMNSQIVMDIKTKGKASDFVRTAPASFAINKDKAERAISKKAEERERQADEAVKIEGGYTGKGGEHLVCSELLFRGFNASIMSVDTGMDIIATKDNRLFSIQVKTANLNKFNTYVFDVRKVSFERHDSGNIHYVFVLRGESDTNFLILPFHEMEKKVHEKAILSVGHGQRYRVNIRLRGDEIFLGSKEHQMNYYLNNWQIIK
jgi:hypothetical protein